MMRRMMAMIMPCREVVGIAAGDGIASQSWGRRVLLRVHLSGCGFCSLFQRQMELIRRAMVENLERLKAEDSRALQDRILQRIRRKP